MAHIQETEGKTRLVDQLNSVAEKLRVALDPIIREVAGSRPRPARLAQRLQIDATLASRLARAFRTEDPFEFMHLVPAPTGLRIFLSAARSADIARDLCDRAASSIRRFESLIDRTPGGRATLDASISASSPRARHRNERSSKQGVYKGMSYLLGIQCEAAATAFIIQPSPDGRMVDSLNIHHRIGIRRLRPTAPVGLSAYRVEEGDSAAPRFETLDGFPAEDAHQFFLPDFSTKPLPHLEVVRDGARTNIVLSEDGPPPESPFDLTFAAAIWNALRRYKDEDTWEEWRSYLLLLPCKTLVRDVFIRDDLYIGTTPEATLHMPGLRGAETARRPGLIGRMNTLDLATPIENLGTGLRRIKIWEMAKYSGLLEHVFERTGWDASRFRGYRVRTIYPVPMIYMNWWFPLQEPPE